MKNQLMKAGSVLALVAVLLLGNATFSNAQNKLTWDKLGTEAVDYAIDHDVVTLQPGSTETYSALKIKVLNGTVNIHKATVHFANGDTQDVNLPKELNADNDGKLIDLKGNKRAIEKVTFWYDTKAASDSKAVVEVWGKV
jgi:hypothetical protein